MFEIDFHRTMLQKYLTIWMKFITIVCCVNSILLFIFHSNKFQFFTLLFPFINCGILDLLFFFLILFSFKKYGKDKNSLYIKSKYPQVWKRLHPFGKYSQNTIAYFSLLRGKFDNGTDDKLNKIKCHEKEKINFILWVNLLTPFFWAINLFIINFFVKA